MSTSQLRLHPRVLAARTDLAEGLEKLRGQFGAGSPGIQLGFFLCDLLDKVVLDIFRAALEDHQDRAALEEGVALVAHSGYGRRDNAPYSDVDLMLMHSPSVNALIPEFAARLVQDLSDVGVDLGFSVRTPRQAVQLAMSDPIICTGLTECRFLDGNEPLYQKFFENFRRTCGRSKKQLIKAIEEARQDERQRFGETVYLLEPNVKRSRGGLRDIHLLRWIGFVAYGESLPRRLKQMGHLSPKDHATLRDARDFLLLLRYGLHFKAGHAQDVLNKPEQLRISENREFEGDEGVLPVERFMQAYFKHTTGIRDVVGNFISTAKWDSPIRMALHNLIGRPTAGGEYLVGPRYVSARRSGMENVRGDLIAVLKLMDLSNRSSKRIDVDLWQNVRDSMAETTINSISHDAAHLFLSLLSESGRLGKLLRRLHGLEVLEKLIPGWAHVRCLLQFNDYHKYTVDEHSLRTVENLTSDQSDPTVLGSVYRSIKNKSTLHLAALIHDIGKGYAEDHSTVGARLARKIAKHLSMPQREADRLEFLVFRHLFMNHLAFRRDASDPAVLAQAASDIGSLENLKMLFVLTCADMAAVGPGVMTQWKLDVLSTLYESLVDTLSGGDDTEPRLTPFRMRFKEAAQQREDREWLESKIDLLPPAYLQTPNPHEILDDLERIRAKNEPAIAWGRYLEHREASEYSIAGTDEISDEIFYRLAGALSSSRLQILSAEAHHIGTDMFLDKFAVQDLDFNGEPPEQRFKEISQRLIAALHADDFEPTFPTVWVSQTKINAVLQPLPTQVLVDNSTSEKYTIFDIFAHDRPGLLYVITKALHELGVSIKVAKIGTYIDQVVDVFYVSDADGKKIFDELYIAEIRSKLYHAIESWKPE